MKTGVFKRIDSRDRNITPFKVYKSFQFTSTSSMDTEGLSRLTAIKPNPKLYAGGVVTLNARQNVESASALINNHISKSASEIYYSINHLYYTRTDKPYETFGHTNPANIERTLFDNATVISIPQKKFGERIKANSVKFVYTGSLGDTTTYTSPVSFSLSDDGYGNLVDDALPAEISDEVFYLGFNDLTYSYDWNVPTSKSADFETKTFNTTVVTANGYFITSSFIIDNNPIGNAIQFNDYNGYIHVRHTPDLNFNNEDDFAISLWAKSTETDDTNRTLVSKRFTKTKESDPSKITYSPRSQYPIEIFWKRNGSSTNVISVRCSDGSSTVNITRTLGTNEYYHITTQKTGSVLELYVDGALTDTASLSSLSYFSNDADIIFANRSIDTKTWEPLPQNAFKGALDEIFIFKKALTATEVGYLANKATLLNTPVVGNVFYEHGIVVISDPRKYYAQKLINSDAGAYFFGDALTDQESNSNQSRPGMYNNFLFQYNATQTLYEHEFLCKIAEDEFNFTMNPTIRKNNDPNGEMPKDWVLEEDTFGPYITTVGLYDDAGQLLAVGKLSSPIKKRDSVETNIIVRFDI